MSKLKNLKAKLFKDGKPTKSFWVYLSNILVWSLIGTFLLIGGIRFVDKKSGYKVLNNHVAVVVSDSMSEVHPNNTSYMPEDSQRLKKGDIIKAQEYKTYEDIKLYDIVVYEAGDGNLICHRVVDKYENDEGKWVVTKGDANPTIDTPISSNLVHGKVVKTLKGVGKVTMFMQSPYFLIALFGSGFSILAGFLIVEIFGKKKKEEDSQKPLKSTGNPKKNDEKPVKNETKSPTKKEAKTPAKKDSKGRFVSAKLIIPFAGCLLALGSISTASALFVANANETSFGIGNSSAPVVTYKTVYIETKQFFNSGASNESVQAYCWSDADSSINNGWPGEATEWVTDMADNKKIFSFNVNTTLYDRIIFTKVVSGTAQLKTVDIQMSSFNENNTVYLDAYDWSGLDYGIPVGFYNR